jgi:hypothetical protein
MYMRVRVLRACVCVCVRLSFCSLFYWYHISFLYTVFRYTSRVFCDKITFAAGVKVVILVQYYTVNSYLFISKCAQHILLGIL